MLLRLRHWLALSAETMVPIESLIQGSEKLLTIFGRWPSFHDAEVIEIKLLRKSDWPEGSGGQGPQLVAKIHTWEMTRQVDDKGY